MPPYREVILCPGSDPEANCDNALGAESELSTLMSVIAVLALTSRRQTGCKHADRHRDA
jgi:hypothetical protein